eukprot:FR744076.1.p2 GENE.FR744076.1~~FR744076.1.p2  ORF type:complete len:113 (+),score=4.84 FR744076.1:236-574(+)
MTSPRKARRLACIFKTTKGGSLKGAERVCARQDQQCRVKQAMPIRPSCVNARGNPMGCRGQLELQITCQARVVIVPCSKVANGTAGVTTADGGLPRNGTKQQLKVKRGGPSV